VPVQNDTFTPIVPWVPGHHFPADPVERRLCQQLFACLARTLQGVVGLLWFPRFVNHRPAARLWKSHAAVLVSHTTSVKYLVVPRDLVAVVLFAVMTEELVGGHGTSLVQDLNSAWCDAVRWTSVARDAVVMTHHGRRRWLEVVFVSILHTHSTQLNCNLLNMIL